MDFVIRRQSEKIESNYNEQEDSHADDNYDYRKWEWGYLRVNFLFFFIIQMLNLNFFSLDRMSKSIFRIILHYICGKTTKKLPINIYGNPFNYCHCTFGDFSSFTSSRSNLNKAKRVFI